MVGRRCGAVSRHAIHSEQFAELTICLDDVALLIGHGHPFGDGVQDGLTLLNRIFRGGVFLAVGLWPAAARVDSHTLALSLKPRTVLDRLAASGPRAPSAAHGPRSSAGGMVQANPAKNIRSLRCSHRSYRWLGPPR